MVPLKYVAGINERSLPETTNPDFEFGYIDISAVGRGELTFEPQRMRFGDAPSRARRLLRDGDTIVSTVRTYLRAVWPVQGDLDSLIASTGFAVLSPHAVDPRYFAWWVQSDVFIEDVVGRSVGVSYPAINALEIGDLPVRVPPLAEQRAIADYLDAETARIDALIAKKQQLIHLLEERWQSVVSDHVWGSTGARIRLKHLTGLPSSGNRDHGSFTDDDSGVPCLRGLNVRPARLDLTNLRYISEGDHARQVQTQLQVGDLVIVRSGLAGAAVRVPRELQPCNCVDLVVVRRSTHVDPRFVEYLINSREAQEQVVQNSVGALLTHFNAIDAGNLSVPDLPLGRQQEIAEQLDHEQLTQSSVAAALARQLHLLAEHRQALITAAVTGDSVVPGAA